MTGDSQSLEERVQRLEDTDSLRALWHSYMLLYDRGGAREELGDMFSDDAIFEARGADSGDRAWRGRDVIEREFFERVSPPRPADDDRVYSGHHGTTCEVEVSGDTAVLAGRFFELTGRGSGTLLAIGGTHTLRFRRAASRWMIESFVLQITFCAQLDTVEPRTAFLGKPPAG